MSSCVCLFIAYVDGGNHDRGIIK